MANTSASSGVKAITSPVPARKEPQSTPCIAEILKSAPLHPSTISVIKSAYALGCDLRIVSDANVFFIETVLKHHGLMDFFSEINTNPSFVDEEGRLRIYCLTMILTPLLMAVVNSALHMCKCKGVVIDRIKASAFADGKKHFIYLGDGKGDFCPSTKLRADDYVMPREGFSSLGLNRNGAVGMNKKGSYFISSTQSSLTTSEFLLH